MLINILQGPITLLSRLLPGMSEYTRCLGREILQWESGF